MFISIRKNKRTFKEEVKMHSGIYCMGEFHDRNQLENFLSMIGVKMIKHSEKISCDENEYVEFFTLSKPIYDDLTGGFWNLKQVHLATKGFDLKKVKGLSNGSVVDCYLAVKENEVRVLRPNPNAKEVYVKMPFEEDIEFRNNEWYI